jgi:hypothetical protein
MSSFIKLSHDFFAILDAQQWRKSSRFRVIAAEYDELRPREFGLDHHRRSTSRSSSSFLGLQASDIGTELEGGVRRQVTLTSSEEKILGVLKALEKREGAPFLLQHAQQRTIHDSRLFADRSRETNERRRRRRRSCKVLQNSGCGLLRCCFLFLQQ